MEDEHRCAQSQVGALLAQYRHCTGAVLGMGAGVKEGCSGPPGCFLLICETRITKRLTLITAIAENLLLCIPYESLHQYSLKRVKKIRTAEVVTPLGTARFPPFSKLGSGANDKESLRTRCRSWRHT